MPLGSTCSLRIATIEVAPQSISTLPCAARSRWKQVLRRPPLPKASPEPRNVRRIEDFVPPSASSGLCGRWRVPPLRSGSHLALSHHLLHPPHILYTQQPPPSPPLHPILPHH